MSTTITDLPIELTAAIFTYLDDVSILTARQACKAVERASLRIFGRRFLRKKGFMLTSASLQVLNDIAAHEDLKKYVQHVWFNPDCYTFLDPIRLLPSEEDEGFDDSGDLLNSEDFGDSLDSTIWRDTARHNAFVECVEDHQEVLHHPVKLQEKLTVALASLPNLFVIGMRRSEDHKPWGWSTLKEATGIDPRILGRIPNGPLPTLSGPTLLFIAIIRSVAESEVKLRRLYTDAIEIDNIETGVLPQATLEKACQSIWYIELNCTKGFVRSYDDKSIDNSQDDQDYYGRGLIKLLSATSNLREIGLMVFPDRKQSHLVAPISRQPQSWRTSYPFISLERLALSPRVNLRFLRRVKLEKITTTAATLRSLLEPSASSLTSLKMRGIRLLSSPSEEEPRPWQPFFAFLNDSCQNLNYILLYHLAHDTGGIRFVAELLPPPPRDPAFPSLPAVTNAGISADFTDYENITVEAKGLEVVRARLQALVEGHWYSRNIFSYAMDDMVWHTDTSDEDW